MKKKDQLLHKVASITESIANKLREHGRDIKDMDSWSHHHACDYAMSRFHIQCEEGLVEVGVSCGWSETPSVDIKPYDDESLRPGQEGSVGVMLDAYMVAVEILAGTGASISVEFTYWARKDE